MRTSSQKLATSATIDANNDAFYGGKAARLAELERLGFRVPAWFAVPATVFGSVLEECGLRERIARRLGGLSPESDELAPACRQVRAHIEQVELPAGLVERVRRSFADEIGDESVAVRSSARSEDGGDLSFAGLHDTYLFVGEEDLLEAIRGVWASAFNERAVRYRLEHDRPLDEIAVGVVVQKMVAPEVSGVMFTANPTNEDVEEILVSALYGAGEGLVGEGLPADSFVVDKIDGAVTSDVVEKPTKLGFDPDRGRGLVEREVPDEKRGRPSLDEETVRLLAEAGEAIERHYGDPQDVEFAVDAEGAVYFLQTRPVTTVDERGPAAGGRQVWDNSNIIESYSGVTTPMTFSFIEQSYTIVYKCFAEVMGIPQETVRRNMPVFENMLGLVRGEVYYNLFNWYRLIRMFPGFEFNAEFMESMMGVDESLDLDEEDLESSFFEKVADLSSLVGLVGRSTWNFARIESIADDFEAHFERHFGQWKDLDFEKMSSRELMELYWEMKEKLLWNWKAPIINDFYVMIFYGLLEKLCDEWVGDEEGTLQHDLICGEGGIATKEASHALIRLAATADETDALREIIVEAPLEEVDERVREADRFPEFVGAVDGYLAEYGARCMEELKLEEPTMRERPEFLYQMIRNYLTAPDPEALDLEARREREMQIREEAERRAFSELSFPRRLVFEKVLEAARRGVKNRENMRFARTRIYGLVRKLLLAVGANFADQGILADREDIFYLTIDEVWDYIKGTAVTTNLRGLVELRREEFDEYRRTPEASPDDRFTTYGPVYHRNSYRRRPGSGGAAGGEGGLSGTGCCSGEIEGEVKVVRSPDDDMELSGEILVAERTDPGWVPLYPSASGVIIERGSVLSHSAIVAREMGLPTVVGVEGATEKLASGDRVRLDGGAGSVEVVDSA